MPPLHNPFRLDHVVITVADLATASRDYADLGFTVIQGGDHPGGITHNALIAFADGSYLELIAFREPAPGMRWWERLANEGEGLVDYALLPSDIARDVAWLRGRGIVYSDPVAGGRQRPDGIRLDWQIAQPDATDLPFFCFDLTPRENRVPHGAAHAHANGATGLASITLGVADPEATRGRLRALLGTDGLRVGATDLIPRALGPGETRQGPIALKLTGLAADLPLHRLHGARIRAA